MFFRQQNFQLANVNITGLRQVIKIINTNKDRRLHTRDATALKETPSVTHTPLALSSTPECFCYR